MNINIFWEDEGCEECADVISVPDTLTDIERVQQDFFDWLFDKNNNHEYWVIVNGEKQGCAYGLGAFINWLNRSELVNNSEKAYIVKEKTRDYLDTDLRLYF